MLLFPCVGLRADEGNGEDDDDDEDWEDTDEEEEGDFDSEGGLSDGEQEDGGVREFLFADEETKSRFTEYSMTSSVMRRNHQLSLLDDRFEKVPYSLVSCLIRIYITARFVYRQMQLKRLHLISFVPPSASPLPPAAAARPFLPVFNGKSDVPQNAKDLH